MEISDIKAKLNLSEVIKHYGYKADKHNRINCPFHDDKTPSMQLYWKTHTAYCFSASCKTHGKSIDVIDFIMYKENITKHEAIERAAALIDTGKLLIVNEQGEKFNSNDSPLSITKTEFLKKMFTYFKNAVHNSPQARQYIESRNLDFTKLEIGYNAGQFHHGARRDETLIQQCLEYGLLLDVGLVGKTGEKAYRVFGKGCIVFALKNKLGETTSLYFRSIVNNPSTGSGQVDAKHFYLKDRKGIYPGYPKAETKSIIITESIIDAATLLQIKSIYENYSVVACFGTNGLNDEIKNCIAELKSLEEIIFFFDGDHAGKESVNKYSAILKKEFLAVRISAVNTPENEDVNSLIQAHTQEIFSHLLEQRIFLFSSENRIEKEKIDFSEIPLSSSTLENNTPEKKQVELLLNAINPYNIIYHGAVAWCSVKGNLWLKQPLEFMKITLQITHPQTRQDIRTKIDLYEYKQVHSLALQCAEKFLLPAEIVENDFSMLAHLLEQYREEQNTNVTKQQFTMKVGENTAAECIAFLKKDGLIKNINALIGNAGVVGEENNRIFLYVIASSYKMKNTLHALIQGSSGSGKTRLLKIISDAMPAEDVKKYTRVTDSSFYNQEEYFFVNKLVCFEDYDGLKEDAQLAVRELQSNEILITSTTIKDDSGKLTGGEKTVRGPIASLGCTTKGEFYEDNISRCFVIAVDESSEQTIRVIHYQNNVAAAIADKKKEKETREFLQNCMRLIQSFEVVNPFANQIKLPEEAHKIRRLNELYQCLVKQITILNQYQRIKDAHGRLISTKEDLQAACEIMFESIVLKVDELDGSLRQFFELLKTFVNKKTKEYQFTRFEIRAATGVSKTQQHHYITRLVQLEYIQEYGFKNRGLKYKINHWDNMTAVRAKIKDSLNNQLAKL
jgi:DNA primase